MSTNEIKPHFELKDEKTGSYDTEIFTQLSAQLIKMEANRLLNWGDLEAIKKVRMNRIAYHIQYLIRKLPFNADLLITPSHIEYGGFVAEYRDNQIRLRLSVMESRSGKLSADCDYILAVECDKNHSLTVTDIQSTQRKVLEQCDKVFDAISIEQ